MSHGRNPSTIYESRFHQRAQSNGEPMYVESHGRRNEPNVVSICLDSPPYQPAGTQYSASTTYNQNQLTGSKYTNVNTANELVEEGISSKLEKIYGKTTRTTTFQPTDTSSPIMSTPFGRCTNMRLSSFGEPAQNGKMEQVPQPMASASDTFIPPVPPPLPDLSFNFIAPASKSHSAEGRPRYS